MQGSITIGDCDYGRGVFATRAIRRGETIVVYRGRRYDREDPIHHTPEASLLLQTGARTYILPVSPAVYVNHSCAPNVGLADALTFVTRRAVAADEELTIDYALGELDPAHVDAVSALVTSVRAVSVNLGPMMLWAGLIAGFVVLGMLTMFAGLVIAFPLLGYATWHAYRELVPSAGT